MSAAGVAAYVERRRSSRLSVRLGVIVCEDSGQFQEQACISSLNAHGVLVALAAPVTVGQRLIIRNPENCAERSGRVTHIGRRNAGRTEVGIEFTKPAPDFWLIRASSETPIDVD
jgi:hypothetical protein